MEYINCILCKEDNMVTVLKGTDLRYSTSNESFNIVRCKKCGLVFINPRPEKTEIGKYYPDNYRTRKTLNAESLKKRIKKYENRFIALRINNPWYMDIPPGANVLDIGCGSGELLMKLNELGCNAYGIDVDEITSKYLCEEMKFNVTTCDIDDGSSFEEDFFDVVIMRHSLEHVHDPVKVMREVRRIIKTNGELIIGVPNIGSIIAKLTGEYWADLDIPRHLFHFNPQTISALLINSGFSVEKIFHEFKVMNRSNIKRWISAKSLSFFTGLRPVVTLTGKIASMFHKGEWIVVKARKEGTIICD